jgi:hypothetical protein
MGWKAIGPTRGQRLIESMPDKSDVKKWFPVGFRRLKYNRRVPASWENAWLAMEFSRCLGCVTKLLPRPFGLRRKFSHTYFVVGLAWTKRSQRWSIFPVCVM